MTPNAERAFFISLIRESVDRENPCHALLLSIGLPNGATSRNSGANAGAFRVENIAFSFCAPAGINDWQRGGSPGCHCTQIQRSSYSTVNLDPAGEGLSGGPVFLPFRPAKLALRWARPTHARSSTSIWTLSMRRSSNAMIRPCAAARSRSAMRQSAGSWPRRVTRRAPSACARRCRRAPRCANARNWCSCGQGSRLTGPCRVGFISIFADYTSLIEPLSLDEAYLDVTENLRAIPTASETAAEIRARIFDETRLTASAGISYNKFLAKLASDRHKPNGQFVVTPAMGAAFVEALAGREIPRCRAGHGRQDAPPRHLHRRRSAAAVVGLPAAALRQVRSVVSRHRQWRGPPSGRCRIARASPPDRKRPSPAT